MSVLPRSYLFVPGNRPDRFDKALACGADAVVFDLEDAVPVAEKECARAAVACWLRDHRDAAPSPQRLVRINASGMPQHEADVSACREGVFGVVLPKSEHVAHLARLAQALPTAALLPLVETAAGMAAAAALAHAPKVQRLVFGSIDFQHDLGIDGDGEELLLFRSQLVLHSRLAGLAAPVDGVSMALDDAACVRAEAQRARRLGFGAKLCIHPRQIAPVHEAFAPTAAQLNWARRVLDGAMVDRPVILRAQALLAQVR